MLLNAQMLTARDPGVNVSPCDQHFSISVCPGEDCGTTWTSREEVLPLLPLEGQEPDRGPGVFLDLLLGLLRAVPGGDDETALIGDDLLELLVAFGPAGVRIAEPRCLTQHVVLDLDH